MLKWCLQSDAMPCPIHGSYRHQVMYVAVSLTLSVLSFELGRRPVESVLRGVKAGRAVEHWTNRLGVDRVRDFLARSRPF